MGVEVGIADLVAGRVGGSETVEGLQESFVFRTADDFSPGAGLAGWVWDQLRHTATQTHRHTDRQKHRHTDTDTHTHIHG